MLGCLNLVSIYMPLDINSISKLLGSNQVVEETGHILHENFYHFNFNDVRCYIIIAICLLLSSVRFVTAVNC